MKLRELLICTALISFILVSANAFRVMPPSDLIAEDKVIRSAYYDTLSILSNNNKCSELFGGPSVSVEVFNDLMATVRKSYFEPLVGIQMSGRITDVSRIGLERNIACSRQCRSMAMAHFIGGVFHTWSLMCLASEHFRQTHERSAC